MLDGVEPTCHEHFGILYPLDWLILVGFKKKLPILNTYSITCKTVILLPLKEVQLLFCQSCDEVRIVSFKR